MSKPPDSPLTRNEYEAFINTIRENYPAIEASTLVVIMISSESAEVSGEILFVDNIRLKVTEVLDFGEQRIEAYGYTVRNSTGTILNLTRTIPHSPARTRITNTFRLTLNTTVFPRRA